MKNHLKLSLWLLITAIIMVPTVSIAQTESAKKAEFTQQVKGYKAARALYKQKRAAGLSSKELEPYKQQMKKTRRRAIALYGLAAFAIAIGAYAAYKKSKSAKSSSQELPLQLQSSQLLFPQVVVPTTYQPKQYEVSEYQRLLFAIKGDEQTMGNHLDEIKFLRQHPDLWIRDQKKMITPEESRTKVQATYEAMMALQPEAQRIFDVLSRLSKMTNITQSAQVKQDYEQLKNTDIPNFMDKFYEIDNARDDFQAEVKKRERAPVMEAFEELPFKKSSQ